MEVEMAGDDGDAGPVNDGEMVESSARKTMERTSFQINVVEVIHDIRMNRDSRREAMYVIAAAILIGLNTGFVNGVTLSQGFLDGNASVDKNEEDRHHNPPTQLTAGLAGSYTNNAIALINDDVDLYLYFLCMILSYMGGSMLVTVITPRARKWMIEPRYGPTLFISGSLLLSSALVAYFQRPSRFIFFLATGALGVQNGISSLFTANLIRCGLTGATTDISLVIGKMLRGNFESAQRGFILAIIVWNFWLGSLLSVPAVDTISFHALFVPAVFFYLLGALAVLYLTERLGIPFRKALLGNWEWPLVLPLVLGKIRPGVTEWTMDDWMQVFEQADRDGNGSLDVEEIRYHLEYGHGVQFPDFQMRVLFRAAKVSNGEITKEEWRQLGLHLASHKFLKMRKT